MSVLMSYGNLQIALKVHSADVSSYFHTNSHRKQGEVRLEPTLLKCVDWKPEIKNTVAYYREKLFPENPVKL